MSTSQLVDGLLSVDGRPTIGLIEVKPGSDEKLSNQLVNFGDLALQPPEPFGVEPLGPTELQQHAHPSEWGANLMRDGCQQLPLRRDLIF